jgi:ribosomal protein S13
LVKISGVYLNTRVGPPGYADATAIAQAYMKHALERLIWGSDWPQKDSKPDDAVLFDLLAEWAPDETTCNCILVANPETLLTITPDKETGIGNRTTEEVVTALQIGIRPDGCILAPIVPSHAAAHLTKDDATTIAAFLQSSPPVQHKVAGPFKSSEKIPCFRSGFCHRERRPLRFQSTRCPRQETLISV